MTTLFRDRIDRQAERGEAAQAREQFPQGYLAVQFGAEFGDDATLRLLAAQIDLIAGAAGLGIVLFRAGAAPWHDDLGAYHRLAGFMACKAVRLFASLDIWDLCALLSRARAYVGSSLHGRIVASAFALPGVNLRSPSQAGAVGKQAAYLATWHPEEAAGVASIEGLSGALLQALAQPTDPLAAAARRRARLARQSWQDVDRLLSSPLGAAE